MLDGVQILVREVLRVGQRIVRWMRAEAKAKLLVSVGGDPEKMWINLGNGWADSLVQH